MVRVIYQTKDGEFEEKIVANYLTIEGAATAAAHTVGDIIKAGGRASIAAAGFSRRWQNALRVDVYPKKGVSANPAVFIYHNIGYAGAFEEPTTIKGDPWLWIPLRHTPRKVYGKKIDPKNLALFGVNLFLMKGTNPPLLAASVRMTDRRAATGKITLSLLRRGATKTTARGNKRRGIVQAIPLFVGKKSVNLTKRFGIYDIVDRAAAQYPSLYAAHLKVD